jgi:hypothetical protein
MWATSPSNPQAKARQDEYWRMKQQCDKPPQPTGDECKDLGAQIAHCENCSDWYEAWDTKWNLGRHIQKINNWRNRVKNLKLIYDKKCTQKCP